jgi:hypothetical protein
MSAAELIIAGATFACMACLGCNHLFIHVKTAHNPANHAGGPKLLPARKDAVPAAEQCALTLEEEAGARKLFES